MSPRKTGTFGKKLLLSSVGLIAIAVSAALGIGHKSAEEPPAGRIAAQVTKVTDGDTLHLSIGGKDETVRLLLVDTPETKDPYKPVQPFGPEASAFAKKTLEGKKVELEKDGPERDKYGRLLGYVWVDGKMFNQILIENGLARVAYVYDPPYTHYDEYVAAEKVAKAAKKGIWSIPGYVQSDGYHPEAAGQGQGTGTKAAGSTASGSASGQAAASARPQEPTSSKAPTPAPKPSGTAPTGQDSGAVTYSSCKDVRAAGKAPLHRGDPGYSARLDGDNDGIACENAS